MSALPRRSTQTITGVTFSSAAMTTSILMPVIVTSIASMCIALGLSHRRGEVLGGKRRHQRFDRGVAEFCVVGKQPSADAAKDLEARDGLALWWGGLLDPLHAALQIRPRAALLGRYGTGEDDVGDLA